jgi:hypothetical protein
MKQLFLFLLMFPFIIFAQPKMNKIAWVGENNEYLSHFSQRTVWYNGECTSLDGAAKQQVMWIVASAGSSPLCQAATTIRDKKTIDDNLQKSYIFANSKNKLSKN